MNTRTLLIGLVVCSFAPSAHAATLTLSPDPAAPGVGKSVAVTVSIDSTIPDNAFSGTLSFPPSLLSVSGIHDGSSIVSLWITRPEEGGDGKISFAGITPGGFAGRGGKLFTVIFTARSAGDAQLALDNLEVLENDGVGTSDSVKTSPVTLSIRGQATSTYVEPSDTTPPDPFAPILAPDPDQGGAQALFFGAVDKGSGIDHYETAEARFPTWLVPLSWKRAESPDTIHDQHLTSDEYVRAVDHAGNARIAVIHRAHLLSPRESLICAIVILTAAFFSARRRRKHP